MTKENIEQVINKIQHEIDEKKIALYKMEGYILGMTKALAEIDALRDLPEEVNKKNKK